MVESKQGPHDSQSTFITDKLIEVIKELPEVQQKHLLNSIRELLVPS